MSGFVKTIIKNHAKIKSPCLVPISNLNYGVVLRSLITRDSGFFIKICINFLNSLPTQIYLTSTSRKNDYSNQRFILYPVS